MAGFPNIRLTSKGRDIIAKANASHKAIEFTKVVLGDGLLAAQNIEGLTSLISEKMVLPVTGGRQVSNDTWSVTAVMDNNNINTGFYVREVGLYARVAGGAEALYAYTNAGNQCDYLPSKENPHQQEITITYAVRNAEKVNIIVDGTVYITKKQLDDHNVDINAHKNLPFVKLSGDTMTGELVIKKTNSDKSAIMLKNQENSTLKLESVKNNPNYMGEIQYTNAQGTEEGLLKLPKKTGVLATQDNVDAALSVLDRITHQRAERGADLSTDVDWNTLKSPDIHNVIGLPTWDASHNRPTIDYKWGMLQVYRAKRADGRSVVHQRYIPYQSGSDGILMAQRMFYEERWNAWEYVYSASRNIAVLTGVISNNGTLPLPAGFSESECTFFVAPETFNPDSYWYDVNEAGYTNMVRYVCWLNGRRVEVGMHVQGFDGWSRSRNSDVIRKDGGAFFIAGKARYLVIGTRR